MPTVVEAFAAFKALCLECLVRYTGQRTDYVTDQLDALGTGIADGRCAVCAEDGPVYRPSGHQGHAGRPSGPSTHWYHRAA
jgi:hypothetical protein